jgi:hypothetical protein
VGPLRPLAPIYGESGARTVVAAELEPTASATYRAAIRRCEPVPPVCGVTVLVAKTRDRAPFRRAVVGTDHAPLKRAHGLAQLLDAPGTGLVDVRVDPCQSTRAARKPRSSK